MNTVVPGFETSIRLSSEKLPGVEIRVPVVVEEPQGEAKGKEPAPDEAVADVAGVAEAGADEAGADVE